MSNAMIRETEATGKPVAVDLVEHDEHEAMEQELHDLRNKVMAADFQAKVNQQTIREMRAGYSEEISRLHAAYVREASQIRNGLEVALTQVEMLASEKWALLDRIGMMASVIKEQKEQRALDMEAFVKERDQLIDRELGHLREINDMKARLARIESGETCAVCLSDEQCTCCNWHADKIHRYTTEARECERCQRTDR